MSVIIFVALCDMGYSLFTILMKHLVLSNCKEPDKTVQRIGNIPATSAKSVVSFFPFIGMSLY